MANYFTDLEHLDKVDWALLNRHDFKHDPDEPGKKERYQAEALVWKCVPIEGLIGVGSYTDTVKQWIEGDLSQRGLPIKTTVQANWYFQ
jgi:hypothetical protein